MYPRIYKRNETDFSHNGEGFLKDLIKCEVIEEDNGMFELEGECAISSFLFEQLHGWQANLKRTCAQPVVLGLCPKLKYPPFYGGIFIVRRKPRDSRVVQ